MQVATLKLNKASTKVPNKYLDFSNIFLEKKALVLPERTNLKNYAIELKNNKQLFYTLIYSLGPIKLETLKIYIKTHLKTGFIWPSKSPAGIFIIFDKKPNNNLCLCVDY